MNTAELIAALDEQIATKLAEVAALQAARKALKGEALEKGAVSTPPKAQKAVNAKERAPKGGLEGAIDAVLRVKPGMTNGEIRDELKAQGYKHSLTPLHVGKRLTAMVEAKRLTMKRDGHLRKYMVKA